MIKNENLASPYDLSAISIERKEERRKQEKCDCENRKKNRKELQSPYDLNSL